VAQIVEAQPLDPDRPRRRRPHPPGEVAAAQRPTPLGREHQPIRAGLGIGSQVVGQGGCGHHRQRHRAHAGRRLGRPERERAAGLGELLGHGDPAVQQVDAIDSQPGQLAPGQSGVGGHQDQRLKRGGIASASSATWSTVANRISVVGSDAAPGTMHGLRDR
jgi:hypothetical protein